VERLRYQQRQKDLYIASFKRELSNAVGAQGIDIYTFICMFCALFWKACISSYEYSRTAEQLISLRMFGNKMIVRINWIVHGLVVNVNCLLVSHPCHTYASPITLLFLVHYLLVGMFHSS